MIVKVSFAALDLQTANITTSTTTVYSPAPRNVQVEGLAQRDGGTFVRASLKPRTFNIAGTLRGLTREACDLLIDQFVLGLQPVQSNFDIDNASGTRRYICTAQAPMITRRAGAGSSANFSVDFIVPSGVGEDIDDTVLLAATPISGVTTNIDLPVGGTYMAEPTTRVTYSVVSGGTAKTVGITNGGTLRGIQITRDWVSGDVLEVDSLNMTVYVNNLVVPFSGVFPQWEPGTGALVITDDMTSRSASVMMTYKRRWL